MKFVTTFIVFLLGFAPIILSLASCGKKCGATETELLLYSEGGCSTEQVSTASSDKYDINISSGFPTATGVGMITRWTQTGSFIDITHDFTTSSGYMPQGVAFLTISGVQKLLMLSYNGATGLIDESTVDGTSYANYLNNTAALAAGTRRMVSTNDGGLLVTRTAGVERFNSAKQRIGVLAKYRTAGTCTVALGTSAQQVFLSGTEYVVVANAQTSPANKINLFNASTGACIAGAAPSGPATTMWPVDMSYDATTNKLFVLYYPFTGALTNAQIWSFDVTPTTINNGALLYDDIYSDIAVLSATPASLSSSITYHKTSSEAFISVGTSNNSVLKFNYDGTTLTKAGTTPFIYQSAFVRSISDVFVLSR